MTPRLQINDTQGKRIVPLDKPLFRIGRRTESDLRVSGVDVSREHAEVEQGDNGRLAASRPRVPLWDVCQQRAGHRARAPARRPDPARHEERR